MIGLNQQLSFNLKTLKKEVLQPSKDLVNSDQVQIQVINLLFAAPAIKQIMTQLSFYNLPLMITVAVSITLALLVIYLLIYGFTTRAYHQIVDNIH